MPLNGVNKKCKKCQKACKQFKQVNVVFCPLYASKRSAVIHQEVLGVKKDIQDLNDLLIDLSELYGLFEQIEELADDFNPNDPSQHKQMIEGWVAKLHAALSATRNSFAKVVSDHKLLKNEELQLSE